MRTLSSFAFCAVYVLVGVLSISSQTIPAELWQRFSSPTAGFSILMPGEPQESTSGPRSNPFYAEGMKLYAASVGLDSGSFDAVERIYRHPIDGPNDVSSNLDRFQSFAAKGAHGRIVSQRDITIQGIRDLQGEGAPND
jgi:hypothetical protein